MINQSIETALPAGEQTDFLIASWSSSTPEAVNGPLLVKLSISAVGPTFGVTVFFAPAAGAAADDVVVLYSTDAIDVTLVPPSGAIVVANANLDCDGYLVPRNLSSPNSVPMTLRISTSGKVGAGNARLQWRWGDPL